MANPSPISLKASLFLIGLVIVVAMLIQIMRLLPAQTPAPTPSPVVTSTLPTTPTSTIPAPPIENPPPVTTTSTTPDATVVRPLPIGMMCDTRNFICISSAWNNASFPSPSTVTGTAIAFENTFQWRLEDANANLLGSGTVMANAPDAGQAGPFAIKAFQLSNWPHVGTGTLTLFEASAKDGSPIHILKVPVTFPSTVAKAVKIALVAKTQAQKDCTQTVDVPLSIGATAVPIEATLRLLLAQTAETIGKNNQTIIPEGTKLISLVLKEGTVTVVFDQQLESGGGGSCRVGAIRAQIENTLKQFPSVKNVVIEVQGKSAAETLQP